jgi:hypothetical protein
MQIRITIIIIIIKANTLTPHSPIHPPIPKYNKHVLMQKLSYTHTHTHNHHPQMASLFFLQFASTYPPNQPTITPPTITNIKKTTSRIM